MSYWVNVPMENIELLNIEEHGAEIVFTTPCKYFKWTFILKNPAKLWAFFSTLVHDYLL